MKKTVVALVAASALAMSGCVVSPEVHKAHAQELGALGAYHEAEKTAIKAEKARKISAGALVKTTAIKLKADADVKQAKANLDEVLKQ